MGQFSAEKRDRQVRRGPKTTLAAHDEASRVQVAQKRDVGESQRRCLRALVSHLGLTLKKESQRAAEQDRINIALAHQQRRMATPNLSFVDETSASTKMMRYTADGRAATLVASGHFVKRRLSSACCSKPVLSRLARSMAR